jgi:hypothetical protein
MLARSALCRLAAAALPRALLTRAPVALTPAARAAVAAHLFSRRSYATSSSDTEPTETVKKAVKAKARAASKASTTKTTTKKAATEKTAAKKAAPKKAKKAAPKKAAPKKAKKTSPKKPNGRPPRELTPEEQTKKTYLALRKTSLVLGQPKLPGNMTAYNIFTGEYLKGKSRPHELLSGVSKAFGDITPAQREHYNHVAKTLNQTRVEEYRAWVESHTPEQIRLANAARSRMRKMMQDSSSKLVKYSNLREIPDERKVFRPRTAFSQFVKDRITDADFNGIALGQRAKLLAAEWRALSEDEKKVYQDHAAADKERYVAEKAESEAKYGSDSSSTA